MFNAILNLVSKKSTESQSEIVAKIHTAFDTEGDRLLAEAKEYLKGAADTEKGKRLLELGFSKTSAATNHVKLEKVKKEKTYLADWIEYYNFYYPNNKFITKKAVDAICEKYKLVLGPVKSYKGDVPLNNIKEMELFKLRDEDMEEIIYVFYERHYEMMGYQYSSRSNATHFSRSIAGVTDYTIEPIAGKSLPKLDKLPFSICGLEKDFDMTGLKSVGRSLVKDDPIVLQPVKGGYLVVTKWGPEASDEIVINPIHQ